MANVPVDVPIAGVPIKPPLQGPVDPEPVRRIRIRHPGYRQGNLLLQFAALDHVDKSSSRDGIWGIHYGTVITACGIIADNAFDKVYLSKDVYGKERAPTYRGVLEHGDYWLQLDGSQLPDPQDPTSEDKRDEVHPYAIVPTFWNWLFPHGKLPAEWQQEHNPPLSPDQLQPTNNMNKVRDEVERCFLSSLRTAIEKAYVIPAAHNTWMTLNEMDQYCSEPGRNTVNNSRNIIPLKADFHTVFDAGGFVIVPKPWVSSRNSDPPSASTINDQSNTNGQSSVDSQPIINLTPTINPISTANPTSTVEAQLYAFVVHVLKPHRDFKDFGDSYHNLAIKTEYMGKIAREYLFARFAWAIFPYLADFLLEAPVPRRLIVLDENGTKSITTKPPQFKELQKRWIASSKAGSNASNSRKRGRGSSDENVELDDEDDAYEERWRCRSASRERWFSDYEYEDRGRGRSRYRDLSPELDNAPGLIDSFSTQDSYEAELDESKAWRDLLEQESQARRDRSGPKNDAPPHSDPTNVVVE
ncbi:hypothetical protein F4803DRAFT_547771 [Xylaria telfairii]|nr:hypothetical protein F4803DRAFT_547771 [Xylaria telfairii]